jgi:hypothetical protein
VASKNVVLNLTASISACLYLPYVALEPGMMLLDVFFYGGDFLSTPLLCYSSKPPSPLWFLLPSSSSTIVSPRCNTRRRSKEVLLKELIACRWGGQ